MKQKKAVILSADQAFAGLIGQVLEDTGAYQPVLARSLAAATQQADPQVNLLVLDAASGLDAQAVQALRSRAPLAKLVLIPNEDKPADLDLAALGAERVLPSPFYLPDLLSAVEELFGPLQPAAERHSYGDPAPRLKNAVREPLPAPAWLDNVSEAASYLARLSLETASHAALIVREGQLWAYAGELPRSAAEELATAVAAGGEADLARFVHLQATAADYMLYGTPLGANFSLALAFDAQAPLSKMRAQVAEAARALVNQPQAAVHGDRAEPANRSTPSGRDFPEDTQPARPDAAPEPAGKPLKLVTDNLQQPSLSYSFALIPRLPRHRLEGDLAQRLSEWLPELCLAFAWPLETLSFDETALQWSVRLAADKPPEVVARIMDQHLSGRIFAEFPRLAQDNPSGEFWAPGYLVTGGRLDEQTLREFIRKTRTRQGLNA
ncbi:MAG: hypothetical protein KIS80_10110 [Anaerolineales bacterium]|nr:hypothetical protein [Anaerolineales bacterium]